MHKATSFLRELWVVTLAVAVLLYLSWLIFDVILPAHSTLLAP